MVCSTFAEVQSQATTKHAPGRLHGCCCRRRRRRRRSVTHSSTFSPAGTQSTTTGIMFALDCKQEIFPIDSCRMYAYNCGRIQHISMTHTHTQGMGRHIRREDIINFVLPFSLDCCCCCWFCWFSRNMSIVEQG